MTDRAWLGLLLLASCACSRPLDTVADARGTDSACVAQMPAPRFADALAPQVEGDLHLDQGIGPRADIRFGPHRVIVSMQANGLFDWTRSQPGLAKLGLSNISAIELEVPRDVCRFSKTAPAVHTCVVVAAGDSETERVQVRFVGSGASAEPRDLRDASAHGGPQVFLLQETLVYGSVISADGEEPSWTLTMAIDFVRGADHASFQQTFSGRAR